MKKLLKSLPFIAFFLFSINVMAQQEVLGNVSDKDGLPLPGATVVIKGTSSGTSTDFDGNFGIEVKSGETLVVSYVGYTTKEIIIGDYTSLSIILE